MAAIRKGISRRPRTADNRRARAGYRGAVISGRGGRRGVGWRRQQRRDLMGWLLLVLLAIGGVIVLGALLPRLTWPTVTAHAGACHLQPHHGKRGTTWSTVCGVVWERDGVRHSAEVDFPRDSVHPGDDVPLIVHGDFAMQRGSLWLGLGFGLAGGLALAIPPRLWLTGRVPFVWPPPRLRPRGPPGPPPASGTPP